MDNLNSPPNSGDQERLVALEERLTRQQRLIDELNEVVLAQRIEIERLGRESSACRRAIEELARSALGGGDLPHEKPPHY